LTAIRTAVRLILKTFAGVELLFSSCERELPPTVDAAQHFIDVH